VKQQIPSTPARFDVNQVWSYATTRRKHVICPASKLHHPHCSSRLISSTHLQQTWKRFFSRYFGDLKYLWIFLNFSFASGITRKVRSNYLRERNLNTSRIQSGDTQQVRSTRSRSKLQVKSYTARRIRRILIISYLLYKPAGAQPRSHFSWISLYS
jgi:hypothetical protein